MLNKVIDFISGNLHKVRICLAVDTLGAAELVA